MNLFDKILCPIDFSENSIKALHWTQQIAKKYGTDVTILHVMESFPATVDIGLDYDQYHSAVVRDMAAFLSPMTIPYRSMQSSGTPAEKITNLAETLGASLIVMATKGLRGMAHRLIGSTAENVIRHSSVPVMTLSPFCSLPGSIARQQTLLPVSDLSWPVPGYVRLRKIIRDLDAPLTMIHVVDMKDQMFGSSFNANPSLVTTYQTAEKTESLRTIGLQIERNSDSVETIVQFGDASKEILKEVETGKYNWILMGAKRHKILSRFFGSTTYGVISQARIPVITIGIH